MSEKKWRYQIIAEPELGDSVNIRIALDGSARAADLVMCLIAAAEVSPESDFRLEVDGYIWRSAEGEYSGDLSPKIQLSMLMGPVSTGSIHFGDGVLLSFRVEDITEQVSTLVEPLVIAKEGMGSGPVNVPVPSPGFRWLFESCHMGSVPMTEDELCVYYEEIAAEVVCRLISPEYSSMHGGCVLRTYEELSAVFGEQKAWLMAVASLGEMILRCDRENAMRQQPGDDGFVDPMDPDEIDDDEYHSTMDELSMRMLGRTS